MGSAPDGSAAVSRYLSSTAASFLILNVTDNVDGKLPGSGHSASARRFRCIGHAKALRAAMKGWGTNEQEIIDILCHRSNQQRQHIRNAYTTELGRDLIEDLKSELGGKFKSVIVGLMMSTADYCAKQLHKAMKGAGTDEETLVEILCSRTFDEVKQIADAYHAAYGNSLDKDIKGDTSGPLQRLLILALQDTRNERYVDARQAAEQAKLLYRAGEGKLGTDEDT